jgi:putative Holliday junction resolvase
MRVLGIDYGRKKVGVAIGDTNSKIASPVAVLKNSGQLPLIDKIVALVNEDGIDLIVVGVPKKNTGELTGQGEVHNRFKLALQAKVGVPVETVDESFTSSESRRLQREYKTDAEEDALSAMLILQEFFERLP